MFQVLYTVLDTAVTISIKHFNRRISPTKNRGTRVAICFSFITAWSLALLFLLFFNCNIMTYLQIEDESTFDVQCGNAAVMEICLAAVEAVTVFAEMLIPLSWLANQHIIFKRKNLLVAAGALFCVM